MHSSKIQNTRQASAEQTYPNPNPNPNNNRCPNPMSNETEKFKNLWWNLHLVSSQTGGSGLANQKPKLAVFVDIELHQADQSQFAMAQAQKLAT